MVRDQLLKLLLATFMVVGGVHLGISSVFAETQTSTKTEKVARLKVHAEERRNMYDQIAKKKRDFRAQQTQEKKELIDRHRQERAAFSATTHAAEERKAFYHRQRDEMVELKRKQKNSETEFYRQFQVELKEFRNKQN